MTLAWKAVVTAEPDLESHKDYPTDPQDWKIELWLEDDASKTYEEVIYVTFTGTLGDNDEVIATPEDVVDARIEAMLKGLNG